MKQAICQLISKLNHWYRTEKYSMGGSPGLVVLGRDSRSEGRRFESRHHILDAHLFTYICCKNCNDVCMKRPKINEKEAGDGPFKKILYADKRFRNGGIMY